MCTKIMQRFHWPHQYVLTAARNGRREDSFMHADGVDRALLGAQVAAGTAFAILQHGDLSPSLLFKGEQVQLAGSDAATAA